MSTEYTLGLFAIKPEHYVALEPVFISASQSLENFDEDWDELENEAYMLARDKALELAEISQVSEAAPLTSFMGVMKQKAPLVLAKHKIYSPGMTKKYLQAIQETETTLGGEDKMIAEIWQQDRSLDKDGIKKFYTAYKHMVAFAAQNNCGFAVAFWGW